jgi:hypothetical protein
MDIATLKKVPVQVRGHSPSAHDYRDLVRQSLTCAWSSASWYVLPVRETRLLKLRQAHGYATAEFEVTEERLGVYLPVGGALGRTASSQLTSGKTEHIDNPKGYGAGEDPRHYHPKLRGPVEVCATAVASLPELTSVAADRA